MKKEVLKYSLLIFLSDFVIKLLIDQTFLLNETKEIFRNFFSLTKYYNEGASFSMMWGFRIILIIVALAVLAYLFNVINKFKKSKRNTFALSFTIGGIIGNLFDRIVYGHVIDYLDFKIFGYDAPVFNLADVAIFIGFILIGYAIIKGEDEYEVTSK